MRIGLSCQFDYCTGTVITGRLNSTFVNYVTNYNLDRNSPLIISRLLCGVSSSFEAFPIIVGRISAAAAWIAIQEILEIPRIESRPTKILASPAPFPDSILPISAVLALLSQQLKISSIDSCTWGLLGEARGTLHGT